jgi:REP element-mobilizing transposase RayT
VHALIASCGDRSIERIVGHLKGRATQQLLSEQVHPLQAHHLPDGSVSSMWVEHGWNVCLNSDDDIERATEYVENNPLKAGLKAQHWNFVRHRV